MAVRAADSKDDGEPAVVLARATGYLLKQVDVALRTEMDRVLRPLGLTTPQYACLEVLAQRPGLSAAGLARATFVTRQTMTVLVRGLEQRGLVRSRTGGSGRALPVTLTVRGRAVLRPASAAVAEVEARLVGGLGPGQRTALDATLRTCLANLTAGTGGTDARGCG
jgi:DNA-binding MarR family transcriptional regulator